MANEGDPGAAALAALDRALAQRPAKDGIDFAAATEALTQLRDQWTHAHRGGAASARDRERLAHLNAVLSVVLAGHFPLGAIPWPEIERARDWLAELLAG